MAVAGDLKTKLSTGGCLTTSEFVCTTEQRDRSREKAREGHRSSLHYVQLCSHAHLIMWLARCKQQLISCRLHARLLCLAALQDWYFSKVFGAVKFPQALTTALKDSLYQSRQFCSFSAWLRDEQNFFCGIIRDAD